MKDKIVVGPAGGERGIQGFLAAYDAKTGKESWRFNTIPHPGEPGNETWEGDSWKTGGASVWITGAYDPELNLIYWGTGNPGPDWNPDDAAGRQPLQRFRDRARCRHRQAEMVLPVHAARRMGFRLGAGSRAGRPDVEGQAAESDAVGQSQRLLLRAGSRDRRVSAGQAIRQAGLGRPESTKPASRSKLPGKRPSTEGTDVYPGVQGGTNWYSPSFSPRTKLFYVTTWDDYHTHYYTWDQKYEARKSFSGRHGVGPVPVDPRGIRSSTGIANWGYGAVRALNPATGEKVWDYKFRDVSDAGILTTASDVLFSGNREGYFFALDARRRQGALEALPGRRSGRVAHHLYGGRRAIRHQSRPGIRCSRSGCASRLTPALRFIY